MKKGYFITFEGAEGSGKSTQIKRAAAYLRLNGKKVLLLREPGGTRVSEAIREIILNKTFKEMKPETELLLYLAARAQIVREKIEPALEKGYIVICDRFEDSTIAYQGYGRKMSIENIKKVSGLFVRADLQPDLTILLDINPKDGMKRGGRHDRMEYQSWVFHHRVWRGFRTLARQQKKRFIKIDAAKSIEEVSSIIQSQLDQRIF
ncbi:MAG: dTMP kinase [Candidatus Omnitrophica bacterium]|nr:dTMP kinase [Candidatus Omnitrophota bacterium]